MQTDTVVHRGKSVIQHGHLNNRVYIMRLDPGEVHDVVRFADDLCQREGYTKVFAKVPASCAAAFADAGYSAEATVPCFYHGREAAVFMAKYTDPARKEALNTAKTAGILAAAVDHTRGRVPQHLPDGFSLMQADTRDAEEIADLYGTVFATYPFPIRDPAYLRESMQEHIRYFIIRKSHLLAAAASCEIDSGNLVVEVTDFATAPPFRGKGFARFLLAAMETDLKKEGILTAYTIARAASLPINMTFAGAGYQFGGLLPNNTNICGSVESMNVWYRRI